ncbi:SurA N-terminal domain-containing protein [Enteractinococcus coprophilus]
MEGAVMPKKLLLSIAAVLAAFSLAACGADGEDAASEGTDQSQQGEQAMPEPDVENIPDVVAEVNGREISGEAFAESYEAQFQQLSMQAQMTGQEPNQDELKSQALDMMINSELLTMEAEDQGLSSSEEDVDELLATMAEENGLESSDALMEEFESQGLSQERVREDLHKEVLIQQVVEDLDVKEPTDDELQEMYDQQVEQLEAMNEQLEEDQAQETPSFEEMEPQLTEQATMQKENEAISGLLDELREQAEIETHI